MTNSERCISRQRAFLRAPGAARADWQVLCQVARCMGFSGFDYEGAHAIFDEHARLSGYRNDGDSARAFNLAALAGLDRRQYDGLEPVQWPVVRDTAGRLRGTPRLFGDGRFAHVGAKARFIATVPRAPAHAAGAEYPLVLNTGRVRDQWHTMTRTGKSARLANHVPEPFVDLHPQDALLHKHTPVRIEPFGVRWHGFVLSRRELALERVANWTRIQGAGFNGYFPKAPTASLEAAWLNFRESSLTLTQSCSLLSPSRQPYCPRRHHQFSAVCTSTSPSKA